MVVIAEPERVSYKEAEERGVPRLLAGAAEHPIAVETAAGGVVLVPVEVVTEVMALLERRDDLYDLLLALTRMVTDRGDRYSLDDVIAELGISRDELDAACD